MSGIKRHHYHWFNKDVMSWQSNSIRGKIDIYRLIMINKRTIKWPHCHHSVGVCCYQNTMRAGRHVKCDKIQISRSGLDMTWLMVKMMKPHIPLYPMSQKTTIIAQPPHHQPQCPSLSEGTGGSLISSQVLSWDWARQLLGRDPLGLCSHVFWGKWIIS